MLSVITYIDRVALSQAAPAVASDLGLTQVEMGWAFSAFGFAYFLFQVPGGWFSDRFGPRRVLTGIVVWWSVFTAATGWAWNQASLVASRFLFGVGQGGGFPVLTKTFAIWLPPAERVRAQGIMWLSARWGGAFTPLLVVFLLQHLTWRGAFGIFGLLGIFWALVFFRWFRDTPARHPRVNPEELAIPAVPCRGRRPERRRAGAVGGRRPVPHGLGVVAAVLLPVSRLVLLHHLAADLPDGSARRVASGIRGPGRTASVLRRNRLGLNRVPHRHPAADGVDGTSRAPPGFRSRLRDCRGHARGLRSRGLAGRRDVADGSGELRERLGRCRPGWATCMDVGGRFAGTLSGTMNAAGNIAAFVAPAFVAYLLAWTGQDWNLTFYVSAGIYCMGAVFWSLIDPADTLEP